MDAARRPDCRRCRAFFVTHVVEHPYGCRTFGIKSRQLPSIAVEHSSGAPCAAFDPRPDGADGSADPGRGTDGSGRRGRR